MTGKQWLSSFLFCAGALALSIGATKTYYSWHGLDLHVLAAWNTGLPILLGMVLMLANMGTICHLDDPVATVFQPESPASAAAPAKAERVRRIPFGEEFHLESPRRVFGPGDVLELSRTDPEKFLDATIVRRDGTSISISVEEAQLMFRNGVLG